jgi:hypothetical protein
MPMYRVTLEGNYSGQQTINTFDMLSGDVPSGENGALLVLAGMGLAPYTGIDIFDDGTFAAALSLAQTVEAFYVQAVCKNLYSNTDFYTFAFPAGTHGQRTGQGMSPVLAAGFTSDRTRLDIRRGQKRFVGVSESDSDAAGYLNSGGLTIWEDVGDAMDNVTVVPVGVGSFTFTPYVFSKERVVDPDTGKVTYEEWETEAEALDHIAKINVWTLKPTVRSQVSRQFGRGS